MIASDSPAEVSGPKFMVPRQRRLTDRPERPRWMYSIPLSLSRHRGFTRPCLHSPVPGYPIAGTAGGRAVAAEGAPAHIHERGAAGPRGAQDGRGRLALGSPDGPGHAG